MTATARAEQLTEREQLVAAEIVASRRDAALDAVRGLAVLLMVLDHAALLAGDLQIIRETFGRVAMPLFFLVAGHLAHRLTWRHGWVLVLGLVLPAVVPWMGTPNVLVWYALGCLLLWLRVPPALLVALALTLGANGWLTLDVFPSSFQPLALFALLGLGRLVPREWFAWGRMLPAWVAAIGRRPLSWYVGHLVVLQLLVEGASWLSKG